MKLVNLTPHVINVHCHGDVVVDVAPSGVVARCTVTSEEVETITTDDGISIPVRRSTFGELKDLPEPQDGVMYIVSRIVLDAAKGRTDLRAPGALKRGPDGQPVGCDGLTI